MKEKLLITASSFPFDKQSTRGIFIYEYADNISKFYEPVVLTHNLAGYKSLEKWGDITIHRFGFLPFGFLSQHFKHGALHGFQKTFVFLFFAPLYFLIQWLNIIRLNKRYKFNAIHAHWIIPQGLAAILYKKLFNRKIKIISTIHGGDIFAFKSRFGNFLKRYVINNVDELCAVSEAIKTEVGKYSTRQCHVIPMGIDIKKFSPESRDASLKLNFSIADGMLLLFVGRLTEKKGIKYLINAMPEIIKHLSKVKLLIVGDGELKKGLMATTKQLDLQDEVIFLGNIEHDLLPKYYASADIFIGPSVIAKNQDSEGFGLVFAEAAACGCLVIASDHPAMSDIIIDGETGITVLQKSSKAIADAVIYWMSHMDTSSEIISQALQHVRQNFSWESITRKYVHVINGMRSSKRL